MFASNPYGSFQFRGLRNDNIHPSAGFTKRPPVIPPPPAPDEAFEEPTFPVQQNPQPIVSIVQEMQFIPAFTAEALKLNALAKTFHSSIEVETECLNEDAFLAPNSEAEKMKSKVETSSPVIKLSKATKKITASKPAKLNRKIVKNFGKAIASFACSEKALRIIDKSLKYSTRKKFLSFVYEHKECIEGNRRFRQLLTIYDSDTAEAQENKAFFRKISMIFMRTYVHQWIWNSKIQNKDLHAQLVSEMKRRIQNPSLLESLSE